ncbi:MAG: 3-hydroxyacyl-CoA dehydrogenase NAD-binding domain-containing protein, partial [Ignavibacteriaceae bacterium]|nr:3-hydroxyacyl-CoA dehydrogenase NAD-binding domain-containing protein [Ignavibacteriaceae bacterium]
MQDENLRLEDLLSASNAPDAKPGINIVAIIGAGVMGQGIGQTIAAHGFEVLMVERDINLLEKSKVHLADSIDYEIKRWSMTNSDKKAILGRIKWQNDLKNINEYDLIIEAVEEDFDIKVKVFQELDKLAKKEAIFVSNTSTLSLTK